jgi:hypothetical protein
LFGSERDKDVAAGWALLEGRWEMFNRGQDFEGSLVAALDWRHTFTDRRDPAEWGKSDVGLLWPTEFGYIEWNPWLPVAFWEQRFTKDRFVLRLGQQTVGQIYGFFRFKDLRVAFSGSLFNAPATVFAGTLASARKFPVPGGFNCTTYCRMGAPLKTTYSGTRSARRNTS